MIKEYFFPTNIANRKKKVFIEGLIIRLLKKVKTDALK